MVRPETHPNETLSRGRVWIPVRIEEPPGRPKDHGHQEQYAEHRRHVRVLLLRSRLCVMKRTQSGFLCRMVARPNKAGERTATAIAKGNQPNKWASTGEETTVASVVEVEEVEVVVGGAVATSEQPKPLVISISTMDAALSFTVLDAAWSRLVRHFRRQSRTQGRSESFSSKENTIG